jgi:aflatoxin B1 aldehyde reductase
MFHGVIRLTYPLRNRAVLDTKVQSFIPGLHTAEKVAASIAASISALKIPKVHIMYLHAPDRTVPFEETCRAINDAFVEGKFEKFGLSNYTPEEVEQIVQICETNHWVKPTAYQGHYNAIARIHEDILIPTLRKHGISYYAYSPGAGGMFSGKITKASVEKPGTRWDKGVSDTQSCRPFCSCLSRLWPF